MERDDIMVVCEGLFGQLKRVKDFLDVVDHALGNEPHHKFRKFVGMKEADAGFLESVFWEVTGKVVCEIFFGGVERYMQQNSCPIPFCHCNSCMVDSVTWNAACFPTG